MVTPFFLLCWYFRAQPTTLLLKYWGDECMPHLKFWGNRPPRSPPMIGDVSMGRPNIKLWGIVPQFPLSIRPWPQSLPVWAFRAILGFGGFAFALRLPEIW